MDSFIQLVVQDGETPHYLLEMITECIFSLLEPANS